MGIYEFEGKKPKFGKGCYIYPEATIIGDVTFGSKCYVGAGAVIRGDYGTVKIGSRTAIEENCVIHARPNDVCKIGNDVTIGHGAIIHNAIVKDGCVIGMGASVSDFTLVGEWAVVGEGAVVKNSTIIEPYQIVVGVPAKPVTKVTPDYMNQWQLFKGLYVELAESRCREGLKRK